MTKPTHGNYDSAYELGLEMVREQPKFAPRNPYDEDQEPQAFRGWEDGAIDAGICSIYTNGELNLK